MMQRSITREELHQVFSYPFWRQRIPLTAEIETPGRNFAHEWSSMHLPESLKGKSFLDVGSNDGMFSFLAEAKGADTVHSTDIYNRDTQSNMTHGWSPYGIELVKKLLESKINIHSHGIYDLDKIDGKFDFVFCSNVIAWLRDPLLAMEQLASKSTQTLFLREDISPDDSSLPMLQLVRKFDSAQETCFYNPNRQWFIDVLRAQGFKKITFQLIDEKKIALDKYRLFQKYEIPAGAEIVESPIQPTVLRKIDLSSIQRSCYAYEGYRYFSDIGWIPEGSLIIMDNAILEPPKWKTSIKKILGKNTDWPQVNYAIIADR
jgi:tRNA (mo5U34)-methyltransferase